MSLNANKNAKINKYNELAKKNEWGNAEINAGASISPV